MVADRVLATTSFGVARRSVEVLREVSTPEGTRYEVRITERDLDEEGRELAVWRGGATVADPTVAVLDRSGARRERSAVYEPESGRLLAEEIGGTSSEGPQLRKRYTYASEAHTPWPTSVAIEEAVPGQSNLVPTVESTLVRDALGRVIEEKRSDGTLTRTTYDRTGGVLRQETGAGAVTLVVRDGRGLPIEEVRPAGRGSTKRAFDSSGALILESTSNASGTPWETRTTLDASGRPVRVDYADGSFETLAYNTDSTVSHRRTRDGVEIDFSYDAANRLTSAVPTLPEGSTSTTRIDAGDHTVYDALSRPTQIERGRNGLPGYDAELGIAIGGYDLASRPLAETVGTRSPLTWTYDAFDRRTRTTIGSSSTLERSYDTLDRLLTITGPNASGATWSWGGDRLYAMTAHGALGTTTRFGYAGGAGPQLPGSTGDDTTWRLATLTWGASGSSAATALPATTWGQFGYGWRGSVTSPSDGAKLGRAALPSTPTLPNLTAGLGWSWSYDAATRLTGAASGQGDLTGASPEIVTERYGFTYGEGDELERLVRESTGAVTAVESGPYGRITSRNGQAFAYDGAGRRLEDDRFVLRWDWRGQLVSATVKPTWPDSDGDGQAEVTPYAGHLVRYAYDAAGRLAHRLHLGALPAGQSDDSLRPFIDQRRYVWEGQSLLSEASYGLEGTEASLRWRKTYVPGPSGLDDAAQVVVEQGNQSRIYTYLRDELGTVQSLVAENESTDPLHPTIAGRYAYSPYGEAHVESAPELLRAHIDGDLTSANGTPQAISDPRVAASGALLLDWSAALDASTLAIGVALETQVGGVWIALTGADVAIALDNSATKLTILPTHGWAASTSYRLRLTPSLHDTLGRALAANETIELRTAAAPSTGVMPAPPFDRRTAVSYESWRAANDTLGTRFPGGQSHLFQGAWTDPVTGMAYHRARWYEPRTAHWLSEDPAGTVDSVNLQAFVGWGPQRGADPLGLLEVSRAFSDAYTAAATEAANPQNSLGERALAVGLALAVAPSAGAEQLLNGVVDTPERMWRSSGGLIREAKAASAAETGEDKLLHAVAAWGHGGTLVLDTTMIEGLLEMALKAQFERQLTRKTSSAAVEAPSSVANPASAEETVFAAPGENQDLTGAQFLDEVLPSGPGNAAWRPAVKVADSQNHHLISNPIVDALEQVGVSRETALALRRNPALQKMSAPGGHVGYETWHIAYDDHMVDYVLSKGPKDFRIDEFFGEIENYYSTGEAARRIPGVALGAP